jgi:hypothetical protein
MRVGTALPEIGSGRTAAQKVILAQQPAQTIGCRVRKLLQNIDGFQALAFPALFLLCGQA